MDCDADYIKMCEKAKEIQKEWKPIEGDCLGEKIIKLKGVIDYRIWINSMDGGKGLFTDEFKQDLIWLPRQDQLQEMVFGEHKADMFLTFYDFNRFVRLGETTYFDEKYSMEQLWLAFVMKEKFSKQWDGKEWLK